MEAWQAEAALDKIEVLKGISQLNTLSDNATQKDILQKEIERLRNLTKKYSLPNNKKIPTSSVIAREVGLVNEHKALFKLFSKLVHPSSYLVNDFTDANSNEVRNILLIHLQIYAIDSFCRICDALSVPKNIRELELDWSQTSEFGIAK